MTHNIVTEFSDLEDLIKDQGDVAIVINMDPDTLGHFYISTYRPFDTTTPSPQDISFNYFTACNPDLLNVDLFSSMYLSCDFDTHYSI